MACIKVHEAVLPGYAGQNFGAAGSFRKELLVFCKCLAVNVDWFFLCQLFLLVPETRLADPDRFSVSRRHKCMTHFWADNFGVFLCSGSAHFH